MTYCKRSCSSLVEGSREGGSRGRVRRTRGRWRRTRGGGGLAQGVSTADFLLLLVRHLLLLAWHLFLLANLVTTSDFFFFLFLSSAGIFLTVPPRAMLRLYTADCYGSSLPRRFPSCSDPPRASRPTECEDQCHLRSYENMDV